MAEMRASPQHLFSWTFDVAFDGDVATTLELAWFRSSGAFELDGRRYDLVRAPNFGEFQLTGPTGVIASAAKHSAFVRRYAIEYGRRRLTLEAASVFTRRFVLLEDGRSVGEVAPTAPFSRRCRLTVPDDMPLSVHVFLLWLVVLQWRRTAQSQH